MTTLNEKIRAIMEGKSADDKAPSLKDDPKAKKEDEGDDADAKKVAAGDNDVADDNDEFKGDKASDVKLGGKKDKAEVKEDLTSVPALGASLKVPGKDTSAAEDNAKIQKNRPNRLGSKESLKDEIKADPQDDNGDNAKIKKGESNRDPAKKLSSPMGEHMAVLFDGETLSEEFKTKAEAIFEVAVNSVVEEYETQLHEEYQQKLDEAVEVVKGELVEQIDGYLDYVVEQWIKDNAVALESGIKVELVNSFISGMKQVFEDHYIDIPEDKVNVVEEQAGRIEELESEVVSLREETELAITEATVVKCEKIISTLSSGLTAIQGEKFRELAEGVEFESVEEFETKAKTIRESYFKDGNSQDVKPAQKLTEEKETSSTVSDVLKVLQKGQLKFVRG